jgi:hypothetical protein
MISGQFGEDGELIFPTELVTANIRHKFDITETDSGSVSE